MSDLYRKGKYTDGPNPNGYFTAGIDAVKADSFGFPDWHFHAIEFHDKIKTEAERRRDEVFALLATTGKTT